MAAATPSRVSAQHSTQASPTVSASPQREQGCDPGQVTSHFPVASAEINLILRTEPRVGLPLLSTEADIKVMIHGHNHTPFLEHRGFSVRPGTETTIGIREVGAGAGRGGGRRRRDFTLKAPPPGRGAPAWEPLQPLH